MGQANDPSEVIFHPRFDVDSVPPQNTQSSHTLEHMELIRLEKMSLFAELLQNHKDVSKRQQQRSGNVSLANIINIPWLEGELLLGSEKTHSLRAKRLGASREVVHSGAQLTLVLDD